ncbi:MAG TPA: NUDIX domain-containing protein [Solirubrobacteraceae bacterium]|jgi:8-oxo-dGTP pyrophosphatase MutT (NUDIX family)
MSTDPGETEFSAGGVVVRDGEVVVIVPTKRGPNGERVLGLPKGHPESGESALEAAVREVREEAGVTGRLIGSLGSIRYTRQRRGRLVPKRVEFFLFEYESGDPEDHDHEIEEAIWMPLSVAAVSLTFEGERQILQRAMSKCLGDL